MWLFPIGMISFSGRDHRDAVEFSVTRDNPAFFPDGFYTGIAISGSAHHIISRGDHWLEIGSGGVNSMPWQPQNHVSSIEPAEVRALLDTIDGRASPASATGR
jgi:hypothetical protein